ncbi:MAG: plasmid replication protein, CyRepA1 family [Elainella sp.]
MLDVIDRQPIPFASLLAADHRQEWLASGVDADLIDLNVETLVDTASQPHAASLFPIAERLNWQVTRFGQPRPTLRGWWVSGIDPLTWMDMAWGRFKPDADTPILDRSKNKPAKYLSPSLGKGSSRLVLLRLPNRIWARVAARSSKPLPAAASQSGPTSGSSAEFWRWVWQEQIPIVLTEGEKKAGHLLSLGYAAIALPGIFSGYRKETGLIPDLAVFATPERQITVCFDYEPRPTAAQQLRIAIAKLGLLLQAAGCSVAVASLPGPQKGIDDFGVAQGAAAVERLLTRALPLKLWQVQQVWSLTYPVGLRLNQPYLGALAYPATGLVAIKSPKGTGKTTALQPLIQQALQQGRRVLVISHRIQLGRAICSSLGIPWIESLARQDLHQPHQSYGLCIDSLHPHSQAQFDPQTWQGAIVIFDEVEQVLWHGLNSLTCYEQRVKILTCLRELVQVVLSSNGLVIAQDADLSDVSLDYLTGLTPQPLTPWLVVNQWQSPQTWPAYLYQTANPAPTVARLCEIAATGAVFLALDSQKAKGRWSSKNLERYLRLRCPDKRILRIDSETVADPDHEAYRIVDQLNHRIVHYDIVLATPTLGTGVSIDISNHFKAVFGIFQGAVADAEARQALARVRDPVPRYIWAAPFGPGKIGNGSPNYRDVISCTTRLVKANIALLKTIDFDIDRQTDPITLRTWAKMAARVNLSLWDFRQQLAQNLAEEQHPITWITADLKPFLTHQLSDESIGPDTREPGPITAAELCQTLTQGVLEIPGYEFLDQHHPRQQTEQVLAGIAEARQQQQIQEALAVSEAAELPAFNYTQIREQRSKTWEEQCLLQKYELQQRYAIAVTPELKLQDDQGWFQQLQIHYYLTHDPALVRLRDYQEWQGHLERGDGKLALQDVRLLTAQVEALKRLGVLEFLNPDREIRASDGDVQQLTSYSIQYHRDLKTLFNLTLSDRMTPIEILQALLSRLGLKLTCIRRDQAADGRRGGPRVYQYRPPKDHRQLVFTQWQQRDQIKTSEQCCPSQLPGTNQTVAKIPEESPFDPPPDIEQNNLSQTGSVCSHQSNQNNSIPANYHPEDKSENTQTNWPQIPARTPSCLFSSA